MKITSKYLNLEFEVAVNETEIDGRMMTLIPHAALEDIIHNRMPEGYNVRYDKTLEYCNGQHCVAKCTITDAHGRRIQDFGESVPNTLSSEVARNIPATMAVIRAFDRAAIRYLAFPGKNVYSSEEFSNQSVEVTEEEQAAPVSQEETASSNVMEEDLSEVMQETMMQTEEEIPVEEAPAVKSKKDKKKKPNEDLGAKMVNFGKFVKTPKTVAEICDNPTNYPWVEWALRQKPSEPDKKAQIEAMREYMDQK